MDAEEAERLEKKVLGRGDMDLEDFLSSLRQMRKMGSMESLLRMIPGVSGKMLKTADMDPKRFKRLEAIILSMTPEERARPKIINASRRRRIASGSGVTVQEVNRLLNQFDQMRKMMKQIGLFSTGKGPGASPRGASTFFN